MIDGSLSVFPTSTIAELRGSDRDSFSSAKQHSNHLVTLCTRLPQESERVEILRATTQPRADSKDWLRRRLFGIWDTTVPVKPDGAAIGQFNELTLELRRHDVLVENLAD